MTADDTFQLIHDAVTAQAQGNLTPELAGRLEALVLSDPEARRLYVQYVRETASLRWWATAHAEPGDPATLAPVAADADQVQLGTDDAAAPDDAPSLNETMVLPSVREKDAAPAAGDEVVLALPPVPPAPPTQRKVSPVRWAMAASILLVAGLAAALLWPRPVENTQVAVSRPGLVIPPPASRPVVAVLAAAADASWDLEDPPHPGAPLRAGPMYLRAGAARITLSGGAEVIVRGPALFELQSPMRVELHSGHLTAEVLDERAHGFTVHTPSATVVDLGTEFGVSVDTAGATEAHVLRGRVELQPAKASAASQLAAGSAAVVDAAGAAATPTAFRPGDFAHAMMAIDLVDVVAGGDGTTNLREAGIDMTTGARVTSPPERTRVSARSDGAFHRYAGRPFVAGVFIPRGGAPETLDPAGHTFTFPATDRNTWYWLWAGGRIPVKDDPDGLTAFPTTIGDVDYNRPGHGVILMRTNKGVTFDLAALRAAHPGRSFTRFRATCANTSLATPTPGRPVSDKSEFRAFVDGRLRFDPPPIRRTDPPFEVSIDLAPDARYLTLVATDGGDTYHLDWITLGDPRLE